MNEIILRWEQFCEDEDIDPDPEAIDDIDTSLPKFATLRARCKAMKGRVNLADRSDFDETMEALGKTTFRAKPQSNVLTLYKNAKHNRA